MLRGSCIRLASLQSRSLSLTSDRFANMTFRVVSQSPADMNFSSRKMGDATQGISAVSDIEDVIKEWKANVKEENLSESDKAIHIAHLKAVQENADTYRDPDTEFVVFSMLSHLRRGYCCGNACRHCPYQQVNVDQKYKDLKRHNTAFYC